MHSVHSVQQVLLPSLDALAALLQYAAPDAGCMDNLTAVARRWAGSVLVNMSTDGLWHAGVGWGANARDALAAGLVVVRVRRVVVCTY